MNPPEPQVTLSTANWCPGMVFAVKDPTSWWPRSRCLALVRLARRYDVWDEDLLRGTGMTVAQLADPVMPVRLEVEVAAARTLVRRVGQPVQLGIEAGLDVPVRTNWDWREALITCSTFGEALGTSVRFFGLTSSQVEVGFVVDEARQTCDVTFRAEDEPDPATALFLVIRVMVGSMVIAREILGHPLPVHGVRLAFARSGGYAQLDEVMSVATTWNENETGVMFDLSVFSIPLPHADARRHQIALDRCEELLAVHAARGGVGGQIRRMLLAQNVFDLEAVARELPFSARTLRRRLAEEGTSFRELADEARMALADDLFRDGASVRDVASALGYAHVSAFTHAFKRWTGLSPEEWRRNRVT